MTTGDLKGCLRKLEASLRSLKYPREVDYQRLAVGDPSACLPIVSFAFTAFSPSLTEHLVDYGVELTGLNDLRFIENVYKVLRDVFSYKPLLTKQQFLQYGFAERKLIILCDIIGLVLNKHKELTKSKVPQKQPLVERHLGSSLAPAPQKLIRCSSEEQPQQDEETEKSFEDSSQTADSIECVLESRLRDVEASLLESVGRLDQRLALMEHRIHALEKSLAGKIIIESNQWVNLESRVLLLETRQALTSAQGLTSGDGVFSTDNGRFSVDTASASGISTVIHLPSDISDNGHTPASFPPTAPQNFKERLDRIVHMMKDTSNFLQNIEPTI
ncbi:centrosomal protein of 44 kDa isoform X4 [Onychostoma macrolepis]|uniref:centrosomal protein of 44 kDa isoform X4 n=1 Tax=Onychostoma macrolepis TaxID=369639 RepID=UPI00272CBBA8|nr:centrosomal protein of 44 kDa isoform X4 [Onychostoma macrolepis]